jgi:ankyrin repeat protein
LLEKCPDLVNKTKKDGSTALHVAAINDHREVAENNRAEFGKKKSRNISCVQD